VLSSSRMSPHKLAIEAKKTRLKQWSVVGDRQQKKALQEEKERHESAMTTSIGKRSKLFWRTNTRLDMNFFATNDDKVVVQAYSKSPALCYDLLFVRRSTIVDFLNKQTKSACDTGIMNYLEQRIQLLPAKVGSSSENQPSAANKDTSSKQSIGTGPKRSPRNLPPLEISSPNTELLSLQIAKLANDVDCEIIVPATEVILPPIDLCTPDEWQKKVHEINSHIDHHIGHARDAARKSQEHQESLKEQMGTMKSTLQIFQKVSKKPTAFSPLLEKPDAKPARHTMHAADIFKRGLSSKYEAPVLTRMTLPHDGSLQHKWQSSMA